MVLLIYKNLRGCGDEFVDPSLSDPADSNTHTCCSFDYDVAFKTKVTGRIECTCLLFTCSDKFHVMMQVWNSGIQVYEVGEWGKYGIMLVADLLSGGIVMLSSGVSFLSLIYSLNYIEKRSLSTYHPLFNLLVAGLHGSFLTGDIFNLFVFFEVLLLSSCGLVVALEKDGVTKSSDKLEATFKYLVLNMLGSILMLIAVSALYATTGT